MISFDVGNDKFNFRVSAIVMDSSKSRFLTNTRGNIDFCVLPGGRVEMGEDSATTLKREFKEELDAEVEVVGIKAITENFFTFDNKNYHELQYVYFVKLLDVEKWEKKTGKFYGVEKKDLFEWQNISDIEKLNYKPRHLKNIIKEVFNGDLSIRHLIHRGNG